MIKSNSISLFNIILPQSISVFNSMIFTRCSSLKNANILCAIKIIKYNIFYQYTSLEKVLISSTVNKIDERAFGGC